MSFTAYYHSPVGWLRITTDNSHVLRIAFVPGAGTGTAPFEQPPILRETIQQLAEYFAGQRSAFELPLRPAGTPFQQTVWRALQTIPYGQTISYRELARRVGKPKAYRAVGNANGKNPIPIIIPCHRVIQSNGALGGYSSGLHIKQFLLELEKKFSS